MEVAKAVYSKDRKCLWITLRWGSAKEDYLVVSLVMNSPVSWLKSGNNLVIRQEKA